MIKNYVKVAFRQLLKNKVFTLINVLGLSVGLAITGLLVLYADYEFSYDQSHQKSDRIYRLTHSRFSEGVEEYKNATNFPEIGLELKNNFAAIENVTRLFFIGNEFTPVFNYTQAGRPESFSESRVFLADSSFLEIFDLEIIRSVNNNPLSNQNSLIISQSLALKTFNSLDVIGKELEWKGQGHYTITGVFKDLPKNSHFDFEILSSWFNVYGQTSLTRWDGFYNYLLFRENIEPQQFLRQAQQYADEYLSEYNESRELSSVLGLQPLRSIHLYSHLQNEHKMNGNAELTYALVIIAAFVLVLAFINYVNFSTSKATERAKEVGIRKAIGSLRSQLITQFLLESLIIVNLSCGLAITAIQIALPYFNHWLNADLLFLPWDQPQFWLILIPGIVLITLIAGFYPAFVMVRFKPVSLIVKGKNESNSTILNFKNFLTTFQFAISIFLITGTVIITEQTQSLQKKETGFRKNEVLVINLFELVSDFRDSTYGYKLEVLKNGIMTDQSVKAAAISSDVPGKQVTWRGVNQSQENEHVISHRVRVSADFSKVYDIPLTAGRFFSTEYSNSKRQLVVNSAWVKAIGFQTDQKAVGKLIPLGPTNYEIIGVVADFHQVSPKYRIEPMIFTTGIGHQSYLSVALNTDNLQTSIRHVEEVWKRVFPTRPFDYFFLENHFQRQFSQDIRTAHVVFFFSLLSILLACMGVLGLSINLAYQRSKEMSIRKVLGASVLSLIQLFIKNYMILILFASLIGLPMAYWITNIWLNNYVFRIELNFIYFLLPVITMMVLTLLSTLSQAIKSAKMNTAEILRKE